MTPATSLGASSATLVLNCHPLAISHHPPIFYQCIIPLSCTATTSNVQAPWTKSTEAPCTQATHLHRSNRSNQHPIAYFCSFLHTSLCFVSFPFGFGDLGFLSTHNSPRGFSTAIVLNCILVAQFHSPPLSWHGFPSHTATLSPFMCQHFGCGTTTLALALAFP